MSADYIEPAAIADIYADGLCDVEILGENIRLIFFTWMRGERVVVAKLVRPANSYLTTDHIQAIIDQKRAELILRQ